MAAGEAFTLIPNVVVPATPEYYNIITQSESAKKEYLNVASTPTEKWELQFPALDDTGFGTLLTHYKENYGGYHSFSWQSVPAYIGGGVNMTGRWVDGSLGMTPIGRSRWKCAIVFEKEV